MSDEDREHHFTRFTRGVSDSLAAIREQLKQLPLTNGLLEKLIHKMSALDDRIVKLQADVAAEDTVIDSAVTLIQGFPALLASAIADAIAQGATPAQLQSFTDLGTKIEDKTKVLADAVAAGTTPPAGP